MIVLDASAVLELLLGGKRARPVTDRLEKLGGAWHAPAHLDLEVGQVLRRWEAAGHLDPARAMAAVGILRRLPVERHPVTPFLSRIWDLRANLTAYDAAYVALAEGLDAPLLTLDARLAGAPGHTATVLRP